MLGSLPSEVGWGLCFPRAYVADVQVGRISAARTGGPYPQLGSSDHIARTLGYSSPAISFAEREEVGLAVWRAERDEAVDDSQLALMVDGRGEHREGAGMLDDARRWVGPEPEVQLRPSRRNTVGGSEQRLPNPRATLGLRHHQNSTLEVGPSGREALPQASRRRRSELPELASAGRLAQLDGGRPGEDLSIRLPGIAVDRDVEAPGLRGRADDLALAAFLRR